MITYPCTATSTKVVKKLTLVVLVAVSFASDAQAESYEMLQRRYKLCVENKVLEDYDLKPPKGERLSTAIRKAQSYCRKWPTEMRLQYTEYHAIEAYMEVMWEVKYRLGRMR